MSLQFETESGLAAKPGLSGQSASVARFARSGCAAVLLAVSVACSPEVEQPEFAVHACQLDAFVVAADGVTLSGIDADVRVAELPPETIVSISGAGDGRLRVVRAVSLEGDVLFEVGAAQGAPAWLPAGAVATSSKALRIASPPQAEAGAADDPGDDGVPEHIVATVGDEMPDSNQPTVPVFSDANGTANPTARLTPEEAVNLLDCRGTWAYIRATSIEGEAVQGWLAPEAQCPNPVTSCS